MSIALRALQANARPSSIRVNIVCVRGVDTNVDAIARVGNQSILLCIRLVHVIHKPFCGISQLIKLLASSQLLPWVLGFWTIQ